MAKKEFPNITMHGGTVNNYSIDIHDNTFHGGTFHLTDLGKNKPATQEADTDPLSAEMLRPYIDAGMLDENLMPTARLSRGETAVLAHDIAERLGLQRFWPIFEQRWGIKYLSSDYNHFTKTAKFIPFQKQLNKIK